MSTLIFVCVALMAVVDIQAAPYECQNEYTPGKYIGEIKVPTNCFTSTPSYCPLDWKHGIPNGISKSKPLIYPEFITCHEGLSVCGYVPIDPKNGTVTGNSGVTIGAGVDLGSKSRSYRGFNSSLASSLVDKLEPYFGLLKDFAACAAIEEPLLLSTNETTQLTNVMKEYIVESVEKRYNEDKERNALEFSSLPRGIRTAIVSVRFQFGFPKAYPKFWNFVKKNDWKKAIKELRNFYNDTAKQQKGDLKRRNNEADIIEATLIECNRSVDAVFLLDESGSVSLQSFSESLDFVKNITRAFSDEKLRGKDGTRFGLSTFSTGYTAHFYLSAYTSRAEYETAINNVVQQNGGTYLGDALERILSDQFIEERGLRGENEGVLRVLIVLTDGKSYDAVEAPAQLVRDENIVIYAIGIGNYNETQLKAVASSDSHVYTLSQFSELETFIANLIAATCNEPQPVSLGNTIRATATKNQYQYFRYSVDEDLNLELNVQDFIGETLVFASRSNPHPYKYDNDIIFETSSQKKKVLIISPKAPVVKRNRSTESEGMLPIYVSVLANTETASFTIKGTTCNPLNCTEGTNQVKTNQVKTNEVKTNEVKPTSGLSLVHGSSPVAFILALLCMLHFHL